MNKTPTPLEPLSVFIMTGKLVSNLSSDTSTISLFGIKIVFGCVRP